jgi:hypothetical protein
MMHLMRLRAGMLCAGVCDERGVCVCVRGRQGGTAGSRRVSSAFAATYTEQLAAGVEKEDWMSTEGIQ